jgi:adenine specific DNA methylase Mod
MVKKALHTLIKGDNLIKLDKVKDNTIDFIYIDPPYATLGKKGNKYNDHFDSHEGWQEFLKPRLEKAKSKLKDTGSIAISIDNTNLAYLILTCNEVFSETNFINTFIWLKQKTNKNGVLNTDHEYVVCYAKAIKKVKINKKKLDVENDKRYKYTDDRANYVEKIATKPAAYGKTNNNPIELNKFRLDECSRLDNISEQQSSPIYKQGIAFDNTYELSSAENSVSTDGQCRTIMKNEPIEVNGHRLHGMDEGMGYAQGSNTHALHILDNDGATSSDYKEPIKQETILIYPRTSWRWCKEKIDWAIKENLVVFKQNKNKEWKVYFKQYRYLTTKKVNGQYKLVPIERTQPYSTVIEDMTNDRALAKVFGAKNKFHYAKPIALIEHLLHIFTDENDIVLDFFAGSGTTTHAANNINRSSIAIQNNENKIFDEVLKVRLDYFKIPYKQKV